MTGKEFNPNSDQPNNPNFADWYASLVCPWDVDRCGNQPLGARGDESRGVSAIGAPHMNAQYMPIPKDDFVQDEPDRRTMSCALCGHLKRKLGEPPFKLDAPPIINDPGREHLYTANWDFHPFGAWLANVIAPAEGVMKVVRQINIWKASNGEEIHGFLWQSTRLLAYDTGHLSGTRKYASHDEMSHDEVDAAELHVMKVCEPSWKLAPQSRDDCAHAAGHGFFYTFLDIGQAIQSCWSDKIVMHTPCGSMPPRPPSGVDPEEWECTRRDQRKDAPKDDTNPCTQYGVPQGTINCGAIGKADMDTDADGRSTGLNPKDLLKWRWLCATGVYHAAGNTLSVEVLSRIGGIGQKAEEFLCKRSNLWGDDAAYFDRCAAGLGIAETEGRLGLVKDGTCPSRMLSDGVTPRQPAPWEARQLKQFGQTQQLSCNPAKYFVMANDQCPGAYRAHFPCKEERKDYQFCLARYHDLCGSHDILREIFQCEEKEPMPKGARLRGPQCVRAAAR